MDERSQSLESQFGEVSLGVSECVDVLEVGICEHLDQILWDPLSGDRNRDGFSLFEVELLSLNVHRLVLCGDQHPHFALAVWLIERVRVEFCCIKIRA